MINTLGLGLPAHFETIQEQINYGLDTKCNCEWHRKQKRFLQIINKLDDEDDQKWMLGFMNWACQIDEERMIMEMEK